MCRRGNINKASHDTNANSSNNATHGVHGNRDQHDQQEGCTLPAVVATVGAPYTTNEPLWLVGWVPSPPPATPAPTTTNESLQLVGGASCSLRLLRRLLHPPTSLYGSLVGFLPLHLHRRLLHPPTSLYGSLVGFLPLHPRRRPLPPPTGLYNSLVGLRTPSTCIAGYYTHQRASMARWLGPYPSTRDAGPYHTQRVSTTRWWDFTPALDPYRSLVGLRTPSTCVAGPYTHQRASMARWLGSYPPSATPAPITPNESLRLVGGLSPRPRLIHPHHPHPSKGLEARLRLEPFCTLFYFIYNLFLYIIVYLK
jgi:hypothetical protein